MNPFMGAAETGMYRKGVSNGSGGSAMMDDGRSSDDRLRRSLVRPRSYVRSPRCSMRMRQCRYWVL
jgi:hypothetical protein